VRHSLILLPPQPSLPHGRHGWSLVTTRCGTRHGPPFLLPARAEERHDRRAHRRRRCASGAESTPKKRRARADSAASSRSVSAPREVGHRGRRLRRGCARRSPSRARRVRR
jgi:hypothetical protein